MSFLKENGKRLSAVLALGGAAFVTGCQDDSGAPEVAEIVRPVRTMLVSDASDLHGRYFIGTARAAREVSLAFPVSGTLTTISVAVGDQVEKDQVVATLDPAPYQAEVDRLSADLESAIATYENAREQTERQRQLFERGHVSQSLLDRATATERSTKASIASVQGALDKAMLNLSYTELGAPFDGMVVAKYVEDFEEIRAQTQVLRVLDSEHIEMVIDIPERYIGLTKYVSDVKVTFDAVGNEEIPAKVTEIGTEASATTRTFPVTLLMDQPENVQVLPGMTGRAKGQVAEEYMPFSNIVVPPAAVFTPEGKTEPHVWIVGSGSNVVTARPVEVGAPRTQGLAINEGLEPGEIIVTAGANSLREGQKVALMNDNGGN
ncbi:efflux RND transporter periplasmic adaptor subunit [Labrenzia sp. PHM005]|uniref:efflux RND transporter periplasmic adaptor subunit n=1 Tax=Labrenzia sp. PHM005 TaxID=2590016 RepID=UPI001140243A|nr:efflux RND transporter periplasmic adaptor subunit [Labrenzia sp. PHM005]QDG74710.1 efflux RND transporter periplasmic adaptor subunit [Labrenzia sp. PHM005]